MLVEREVAVVQQVVDIVVVAEAALGGQSREEPPKISAAHNSDERLWIATDQEFDELDIVWTLERRSQRGLKLVSVHVLGERRGWAWGVERAVCLSLV